MSKPLQASTAGSRRDHRIDWLRGLALVTIFINHMPGNRFENWTSRNFGFSDAAEVFVALAGVAAAAAFFPKFAEGQGAIITGKIAKRAHTLYLAHLATTLAAVVVFVGYVSLTGDREVYEAIGIMALLTDPVSGTAGILAGTYQLGYFNILPLYIALMVLLPGLLWLAVRDVRLMLAASLALYLAGQLLPINLPSWPSVSGWFFNPFDWQLLYAIGLALGIMRIRGAKIGWHPAVGALALAYVGYALVWMLGSFGGRVSLEQLPEWVDTLGKTTESPARLLHVLALGYLLVHSPIWAMLARLDKDAMLTRLGRNSLPVFAVSSVLSMIGALTIRYTGPALWLEFAIVVVGVALMAALAKAIETGMVRRLSSAAGQHVDRLTTSVAGVTRLPALSHNMRTML